MVEKLAVEKADWLEMKMVVETVVKLADVLVALKAEKKAA